MLAIAEAPVKWILHQSGTGKNRTRLWLNPKAPILINLCTSSRGNRVILCEFCGTARKWSLWCVLLVRTVMILKKHGSRRNPLMTAMSFVRRVLSAYARNAGYESSKTSLILRTTIWSLISTSLLTSYRRLSLSIVSFHFLLQTYETQQIREFKTF